MNTARGIVRAGSRTSPLGTRAISMPAKAKINVIDAAPIRSGDAHSIARCSGFTQRSPAAVSTSSGSSLATVMTSIRRAPMATPRTLTQANVPNTRPRPSALRMDVLRAGAIRATDAARALATDAAASRQANHTRNPVRNPTKRTERHFHVGVDSAGQRHPAPGHRERRDDEGHRQAAREIRQGCGRTEVARGERGQDEDARADCHVDDARCEPTHADRAHEPPFAAECGRHGLEPDSCALIRSSEYRTVHLRGR